MSEELKPCPFCGDEAWDARRGAYCGACEAGGEDSPIATKLWNTRPLEAALQAKLDKAEDDLRELEEWRTVDPEIKKPEDLWQLRSSYEHLRDKYR